MDTTTENYSVGFIGGGNMASSIIGGLVPDIVKNESIFVFDPNADQLKKLSHEFGISLCKDNTELVQHCDVIILAVKPQMMAKVLTPIAQELLDKQPLIISIVAGISCDLINQILAQATQSKQSHSVDISIIRVMPNTPALVKSGASGMYANQTINSEQKTIAQTLMKAVGSAFWVDKEADIDAVTALSGSGPAYFMLFVKSLIESAERAGLPSDIAKQLAMDTCAGSAKLMQMSEVPIEQLIKNVTSPGGTTEQALLSFENAQLANIIDQAFQAALKRSEQLGTELTEKI